MPRDRRALCRRPFDMFRPSVSVRVIRGSCLEVLSLLDRGLKPS